MEQYMDRRIKFSSILLVFLLLLPFLIFFWIYPNDWFGWTIVLTTYVLPLFVRPFNTNKGLLLVTYISLTAHHVISFTNSYIRTTFGANQDAATFYHQSSLISKSNYLLDISFGSDFYQMFLVNVFKVFGDSKFLGCELSVLAFLISLITIIKISDVLNKTKYHISIALLYGLLPTCLLYTSVTLREAYQMMFFSLCVYFGLKFINYKGIKNFIKLVVSLVCLGVLHNGLMAAIPILLIIVMLFSLNGTKKKKFGFGIKVLLGILSLVVVSFSFMFFTKLGFSTQASQSLLNGDILEYSSQYRENSVESGATYGGTLQTSSIGSFISSIPIMFINYMFAPYVWQYRGLIDIYAGFESVIRFFLLYSVLRTKQSDKITKRNYLFAIFFYLVLEMIWAAGTSNWGTSIRHHLVGYGVILVLGIEGLFAFRKKKIVLK